MGIEWIVKDNVIIGVKNNELIVPNVNEIFSAKDDIVVGGECYPFNVETIRFSKLISLDTTLVFEYSNQNIKTCIYANKKNEKYEIAFFEGRSLGYVIIDGVWHYLDSSYDVVCEVFEKFGLNLNCSLDYFQYIKVINEIQAKGIEFEDKVVGAINSIKKSVVDTQVESLNDVFFPYQKAGVNWLSFMSEGGCGCILGDEMGLGKTLQVIGLLASRKQKMMDAHFLIVAPISLLVNWKRELEKFCPSLTVHVHHGNRRIGYFRELLNYDVVITSYGNIQSDISMFNMINWDILVVDEAQGIKNPHSKRRNYLSEIKRRMTVAMTGTPFENHVSDIWSISDFVIPGYFGALNEFTSKYEDDLFSAGEIERMLSPIMIRRRVCDVANDLPERVEISQPIIMKDDEADFYENERNELNGKLALNQIRIDLIQGLRMFCSHPIVYRPDLSEVDPITISNKYRRTCEILEEIVSYGEKVLIFTSFNKMIDVLCQDLPQRFGIPTMFINGNVDSQQRQSIIDEFSKIEGSAVLVLNPKAAGAGLNITCANHVIHYNLEWNPAVEAQASARAYRRGQSKTVFIYRLFYEGTIEEFINNKIENKQEIFNAAIVGNKGEIQSSELINALSYSPRKEMLAYES